MRELEAHHVAWLLAHPERTEEWLRERLSDGFDIHHLNGDRDNNSPTNLVLIDAADHMMLHNGKARMERKPRTKRKLRVTELADGQIIRLLPRECARVARKKCHAFGIQEHRKVTDADREKYRLVLTF